MKLLTGAVACAAVFVAAAVSGASADAAKLGIVPPHNPARNCSSGTVNALTLTVSSIDICRAQEGIGPLTLPSNFWQLPAPEQLLVLIDLERVNRGLAPVAGLASSLNSLAQTGATQHTDPPFPFGGFLAAGGLWAQAYSAIGADFGWMYDDGWGGSVSNADCTSPQATGCWGHRDIILLHSPRGPLVAGGADTTISSAGSGMPTAYSYAFEILAGYHATGLAFTWKHELTYFTRAPGKEPLQLPKITQLTPSSGSVAGAETVAVIGSNLLGVKTIDFGTDAGTALHCTTETSCTVQAPAQGAGTVSVIAVNLRGQSRVSAATKFTYVS